MLLIPFDRKIDWKRPPVVTFLLMVVNVFVFFAFQIKDDAREQTAIRFFVESSLPAIEGPLYLDYLEKAGRTKEANDLRPLIEKKQGKHPRLLYAMEIDVPFMKGLRAGKWVTPDNPRHPVWGKERAQLDELMAKNFTHRYSLRPAYADPITFLSHMFLHGDFGHLFGNMLFLVLMGYAVEATLGGTRYLLAYLLSGLCSAGLDVLIHPNSGIYSLGASGAISGVMGMYAVLFGLRKIRFFYWVVFYFDYVKAPAIIMLPLWLGKECYELFLGGPSNTNYLAHIGGLIAGGLIAFAAGRTQNAVDREYLDQNDKADAYKRKYEDGIRSLAALEISKAERIFRELHETHPEDRQLLIQRYNIAKLAPASDNYHAIAHRILHLPDHAPETVKLQHATYVEYMRIAKPVFRLPTARLPSLAKRFASGGFLDEAERIVCILLKSPSAPLAPVLLALGAGFARKNQPEKSRQYLELVTSRHAGSAEANHARQLLEKTIYP